MPADAASPFSLAAVLPEIILLVAACAVLLVGQSGRESVARWTAWLTFGAVVLAGFALLAVGREIRDIGSGLENSALAYFVRLAALILAFVLTLVCWSQPRSDERGEFFAMMLMALSGLMLVGLSTDLVVLFLALELVSIPTYVMVSISRRRPAALEAGTKYFYLGALAAAITAYGFSFLYGVSGTASLSGTVDALASALSQPGTQAYGLATIGVVLSLSGLLFKIAAVPLHFYIADVYQGAASPVAGFLGFVPKLAGLVAILKVIQATDHWNRDHLGVFWLLWLVAVASMTVGNVLALRQTNIKRLLGYSGIAHSGYMLVGLLVGPEGSDGMLGDGIAAVLFYVVIYGLANLGAFAILGLLSVRGRPCETLRDIAGLLRRHPGLALLMALAMFTLMGLPPTPGFWGKLSLFGSALAASQYALPGYQSWIVALVIIAVLNSALAAAYYLRVIAACLLYESDEPAEAAPREAQNMGALVCGFLLLIFAVHPGLLLRPSRDATSTLRGPASFSTSAPPAPAQDAGASSVANGSESPLPRDG